MDPLSMSITPDSATLSPLSAIMSIASSANSRRDSLESPIPSSDEDNCNNATSKAVAIPATPAAGNGMIKRKRRKKKRLAESLSCTRFSDVYYLTGDVLGQGSYGRVETCINRFTNVEYAVKIVSKENWAFSRAKILKEVELYYLCQGQNEIIQLIEYFEEPDNFYLIFEKAYGGPLLDQIQSRVHFSEKEATNIVRDLAKALMFLHERGIAHRDLKPENILCVDANAPWPIKLCDFDLCSGVHQTISTPLLQSPVGSAEYMAPEVVNAFSFHDSFDDDDDDELTYDKRCDLWSLGIITYILLCGYLPFSAASTECSNKQFGKSCGWDSGEECLECQKSLFEAIKNGTLVFPEDHWSSVSPEAKDLISKLLVKEASLRIDARSVLEHPWIKNGGCRETKLETPSVLRRQTSVKELSEFTSSAMMIKRNFEQPSMPFSFTRALETDDMVSSTMSLSSRVASMKQSLKQGNQRKCSVGNYYKGPHHAGNLKMRRQTSMVLPEDAMLIHVSPQTLQRFEF